MRRGITVTVKRLDDWGGLEPALFRAFRACVLVVSAIAIAMLLAADHGNSHPRLQFGQVHIAVLVAVQPLEAEIKAATELVFR